MEHVRVSANHSAGVKIKIICIFHVHSSLDHTCILGVHCYCNTTDIFSIINTIILSIILGGLVIYKVVMIVWRKRAQAANSAEDQQGSSAHFTERQGGSRGKDRAMKIELEQNQAYGSSA